MPDPHPDRPRARTPLLMRAWWLHPVLLGAFPVIFLFAANIREQITLEPLGLPLALAVGGTALVLGIIAVALKLAGRDVARGGLLASLLVVLFFSYGHVWQTVADTLVLHRYLLAAWGAIGLIGVILALRVRANRVRTATGALNLGALILVALNLLPIVQFQLASTPAGAATSAPGSAAPAAQLGDGPRRDIWYLIFDRYAGSDALSRIYGYDNRPFLDELEQRGFAVAEHSTANYLKTALSLASTLEMDYLDADALASAAAAPDDWTPLYRLLQGSHAVERFVHAQGYEYLHFGVLRGATYTNTEADRVFLYGNQTEFSAVLRETTLLVAAENLLGSDFPGEYARLYANQTLYQFSTLDLLGTAESRDPRFIFAHFLIPHPPYAFNADGTWVTREQQVARDEPEEYLEQLQFTNDRILDLLDTLLDKPEEERPIVLIQADEGPFPPRYANDEEGFRWEEATEEELIQKFSILAAYHVPGMTGDELGVYPGITPVNSFRVIFNAAFGTDLEMLPDRNFIFVDQRHIYDMVDITDRLAAIR